MPGTAEGMGDQDLDTTTGMSEVGESVADDSQGDTAGGDGTAEGLQAGAQPDQDAASTDAGATQPPQQAQELDLLSQEEYEALKSNPEALRKALNRSYTQKTQELAPYRRFVESFDKDPIGTTLSLVRALNIPPDILAQHVGSLGQSGQVPPASPQQQAVDNMQQQIAEVFGSDAARVMEPYIRKLVDDQLGPLRQPVEQHRQTMASDAARATVVELEKVYPDWKKFEPKMLEWSRKIAPDKDMSAIDYATTLYRLAKSDLGVSDAAQAAIKRINNSVKASEPRPGASPRHQPPTVQSGRLPTIREALSAAMEGRTLE